MAIEIRTIAEEELETFSLSQNMAFGRDYHPERLEGRKRTFEFDRNLAAFDDGRSVGTAGIFSYQMTVPGGSVPAAGVTMVSVRPTHRRRGVLTGLMAAQLDQVAERGEPVAILWASEAPIYGRFGYGQASEYHELTLPREYARFARPVAAPGTLRQLDVAEAREMLPAVWEAVAPRYPGFISRSSGWWEQRVFGDIPEWREGFTANFYIAYENAGNIEGYVRYRVKSGWSERDLPEGIVKVEELMPVTQDAFGALWSYIFGVDLVNEIKAGFRRPDEPLAHMLVDSRRLATITKDGLFLRVVDVEAALSARRYTVAGRVVMDVTDAFRPQTSGRYLLEGGPEGAACRRTHEAPEISLGITELGAAYLGGTRLATLAEAGRVTGGPEAIARADQMFSWPVAPWCPEMF